MSYVISPSSQSLYLRKQGDYPTALIDPDGNERASVQLRNSDLNAIQILLLQLKQNDLDSIQRAAVRGAVLRIIEANRPEWAKTLAQLNEELTALRKAIELSRFRSCFASPTNGIGPSYGASRKDEENSPNPICRSSPRIIGTSRARIQSRSEPRVFLADLHSLGVDGRRQRNPARGRNRSPL